MLEAMAPVTERAPIDAALNTHANPDHCFGNELLASATEIYASVASAQEMGRLSPEVLQALKSAPDMPPHLADFVAHAFGPFDFSNITFRAPSRTFEGRMELSVGDRAVTFLELGPAHTGGDTIVHHEGDPFRALSARPGAGRAFFDAVAPRFNRLVLFDDRMPHAVAQLVENLHPKLRALGVLKPQPEHLARAVQADRHGQIARLALNAAAIADLEHQAVQEHDRVHILQRP